MMWQPLVRIARPFEGHDSRGECLHNFIVLIQCLNIERDSPAITLWIGGYVTDLDLESQDIPRSDRLLPLYFPSRTD
jgi:hypothetical protein